MCCEIICQYASKPGRPTQSLTSYSCFSGKERHAEFLNTPRITFKSGLQCEHMAVLSHTVQTPGAVPPPVSESTLGTLSDSCAFCTFICLCIYLRMCRVSGQLVAIGSLLLTYMFWKLNWLELDSKPLYVQRQYLLLLLWPQIPSRRATSKYATWGFRVEYRLHLRSFPQVTCQYPISTHMLGVQLKKRIQFQESIQRRQ